MDRAEEALAQAQRTVEEVLGTPQAPVSAEVGGAAASPHAHANVIENDWLRVEVNPAFGGIVSLMDKRTGREWVDHSSEEPFGGYRYDLYSAADIAEFMRAYGLFFQDWFVQDFGKAGYPEDSVHVTEYARNFELVAANQADQGVASGATAIRMVGGRLRARVPGQRVSITVSLPGDPHHDDVSLPYVDLEYRIEGKVATHLAESAVVPFPLNLPNPGFRLGQVGSVIDPTRGIAEGANRSLWCVDGWVDASDDRVGFGVIPLDMPLVSLGSVGIFEFDPRRVPTEPVIYSHLFNTQWGTNFRQWHEGDFSFRVRLVPHVGDWRYAHIGETALDTLARLSGTGAYRHDWPVKAADGFRLYAMRPRHDGSGLIMRFWDAWGLARDAHFMMQGPVSAVWRCDLMERPLEKLQHDSYAGNTTIKLPMAGHAIETLLVEFEP